MLVPPDQMSNRSLVCSLQRGHLIPDTRSLKAPRPEHPIEELRVSESLSSYRFSEFQVMPGQAEKYQSETHQLRGYLVGLRPAVARQDWLISPEGSPVLGRGPVAELRRDLCCPVESEVSFDSQMDSALILRTTFVPDPWFPAEREAAEGEAEGIRCPFRPSGGSHHPSKTVEGVVSPAVELQDPEEPSESDPFAYHPVESDRFRGAVDR